MPKILISKLQFFWTACSLYKPQWFHYGHPRHMFLSLLLFIYILYVNIYLVTMCKNNGKKVNWNWNWSLILKFCFCYFLNIRQNKTYWQFTPKILLCYVFPVSVITFGKNIFTHLMGTILTEWALILKRNIFNMFFFFQLESFEMSSQR